MGKDEYIRSNVDRLFCSTLYKATSFGALLFLFVGILDYVVTPENFPLFLRYRILIASFLLVVALLSKKISNMNLQYLTAYAAVAASAFTIECMVLHFGGHLSPYYAGMILLGVCVVGFIPVNFRFQVSSALVIYLMYLVPIITSEKISDPEKFFMNNFFILSIFSASLFFGYLNYRRLTNELHLQFQLDSNKKELEVYSSSLKKLVEEKTADLVKANRELQTEISERRRAAEELQRSQEQLRNLFARVQAVREEERTRIARELHDELGQILTALKMDLSTLHAAYTGHGPFAERSKSMMKVIDSTIQSVRRILSELRPGILDHLGLPAALEWQAKEFQTRTGIQCKFTMDSSDISLDTETATALFRMFQEALTNVLKHADATRIRISLEEKKGEVILCIWDNGRGITDEEIRNPNSLGLVGIHERARILGGTAAIKRMKNKGSMVRVSLPLTGTLWDFKTGPRSGFSPHT